MTRFAELLRVLASGGVRFIVVGGVAAAAHGSPRSTQDVDIVYECDGENLRRIDLLREIAGVGGYENLVSQCLTVEVFGIQCKLINLDALILAKRAAGRPKDLEDLAELVLLQERRKRVY